MRAEPIAEELERLRRETLELRQRAVDLVDGARLAAWLRDPERRPASTAFTAGAERNLAREIELSWRLREDAAAAYRPMDSAPLDGTEIIVRFQREHRWHRGLAHWNGSEWVDLYGRPVCSAHLASGWLPVPEAR